MATSASYAGMKGLAAEFVVASSCCARDLFASLGVSKSVLARAFVEGQIVRYGASGEERLTPISPLNEGDVVALVSRVVRHEGRTSDEPVTVLFEDDFVIAAEKPAGILVHADGTDAPTLTERVQGHVRRNGESWVPQALQRLDVETSGIVLFSKTEEWQAPFDALIAEGGIEKRYLAVVAGVFDRPSAVVRARIGRDRHDARRMRVSANGQEARTDVRRLAVDEGKGVSLLDVRLGTGRRHQIRVHLASLGFPVLGDGLYGAAAPRDGLMLHAAREGFVHPVTGREVLIRSPWPQRFSTFFSEDAASALFSA